MYCDEFVRSAEIPRAPGLESCGILSPALEIACDSGSRPGYNCRRAGFPAAIAPPHTAAGQCADQPGPSASWDRTAGSRARAALAPQWADTLQKTARCPPEYATAQPPLPEVSPRIAHTVRDPEGNSNNRPCRPATCRSA